ncbi:unknown_gene_8726 [Phodopus roborovskii]|uniref:Olfactory receptor n=1 Tax=Phodopus roborovskii TaxID=109678 RepID=A0AAU9ZID4_PHORO|nr:unknown_gene_8726 [Phodopus roborovskii]
MAEDNYSVTNEFILVGFLDHPEMKTLLFLVFSAIYLITMVGNLGLVVLIYMEHRLHTPMYIFLGNLMLENFLSVDRRISLYECMVQFYFLCLAETADCFLLAAMAYDRYVAICNPLQYHTMMSKKLCLQMTAGAYIAGNLHSMIHIGFMFRLTFCRSHVIKHFFCDFLPLYRLSCVDPYLNELMILIFAGLIQIFTITVVLVSYLYILFTIFTMKSKDGRDIPVAIFYTVVIPLLNPFIYSLRNKEVINVMKRTMRKRCFHIFRKQGSSPLEN